MGNASPGRMLETASVLCAIARCAPPHELTAYGHRLARGLQATLSRIRRDYEGRYIGGDLQAAGCRMNGETAARDLLHGLRRLTGGDSAAPPDDGEVDAFATFVRDMDELLSGCARSHLMEHQPLATRLAPSRHLPH
jgi:hypothetical protein